MSAGPVVVVCHDVVGPRQAGPGIRAWHLAAELARHVDVILAVPGESGQADAPFAVWPYRRGDWSSLSPVAQRAGSILAAGDSLAEFPALEHLDVPLIVDGYDPHTLETLALWQAEPLPVQAGRHGERVSVVRRQCRAADFLICASERQRDWWLGVLEEQGRVNPLTYADDPSLRRLIDVVPFGLPAGLPHAARPVMRGVWPGIGAEDWIVLWGGGLWEWLDPLTALRAARRLAGQGIPLRLVFPGTRHPNPATPDMPMRARAVALADELELTGRTVFFGDWVPYEDWPAVLLEADVGVSLHPDTVEARLAYRTRVLDYVWAGLPMVVTGGDEAAGLVERWKLGCVVPYGDDAAVAEALAALLCRGRAGLREKHGPRFEAVRRELSWERAAAPLVAFCRAPHRAVDRVQAGPWAQPGTEAVPGGRESGRERQQGGQPMIASPRPTGNGPTPAVSVVVLTWNGAAYVEACLAALLAQASEATLEVLVVDNGSTDGTAGLVARQFPGVRLIRHERNLGFSAGNNAGLRAAGGEVLVLLNQDTVVHPGWLAALLAAFDDPAVGIAGCKLLYPNGTIQHAGGFIYGPCADADHHGRGAPDDGRFDQAADAEFVTGAALAIRRAAMEQIGLLDEGFSPAYYEDIDWCYRARAAGWRVRYVPGAVVTHFESTATGAETYARKFAVTQGRVRFALKHWPLDRLLAEFGPAERLWVAAPDRGIKVMGARGAYLAVLLGLPEIVASRPGEPAAETEALLGLLVDLRAAAMAGLETLGAADGRPDDEGARLRTRLLDELAAGQTLREQPFTSNVPVIGRLIAAVRTVWNSVSTKWYVRPLAHQQSVFNAQMVGYVRLLQDQAAGQLQESAENVRELTALAERLARLEAELREVSAGRLQPGVPH